MFLAHSLLLLDSIRFLSDILIWVMQGGIMRRPHPSIVSLRFYMFFIRIFFYVWVRLGVLLIHPLLVKSSISFEFTEMLKFEVG